MQKFTVICSKYACVLPTFCVCADLKKKKRGSEKKDRESESLE